MKVREMKKSFPICARRRQRVAKARESMKRTHDDIKVAIGQFEAVLAVRQLGKRGRRVATDDDRQVRHLDRAFLVRVRFVVLLVAQDDTGLEAEDLVAVATPDLERSLEILERREKLERRERVSRAKAATAREELTSSS